MAEVTGEWTPKRVDESRPIGFNFAAALASGDSLVGAGTWAVRLYRGTDPSPGDLLSGSPSVSGATVSHVVAGGVDGALYEVEARVTTANGEQLEACSILRVSDDCS